jgi:hypothetical protein
MVSKAELSLKDLLVPTTARHHDLHAPMSARLKNQQNCRAKKMKLT